jgi:ceramide glucosyltransferase
VVQALREQYPQAQCRLVVSTDQPARNPKVRNLLDLLPQANHDLLLVSDSNIRAPAHYLSELVATLHRDPRIGVVTSLFAGTGESSLGAALEAVQLNGFCAAGAALPAALGDSLPVGKPMLFSRRVWNQIGGFERVFSVLAEDFVTGRLLQHAGYRIALAPTVLHNQTGRLTLSAFLQRHLRWAMLRWRLRPAAAVLEVVSSPLALLPAALLVGGGAGCDQSVLQMPSELADK